MKIWLLAVLWLGLAGSANAQTAVEASDGSCAPERAAVQAKQAEYAQVSPVRSFFQPSAESMAVSRLDTAKNELAACQQGLENKEKADEQDRQQNQFWDSPAGKAITKANKIVNGRVNVATFTPIEWTRGSGATPWTQIGNTEAKSFFYTAGSKHYVTYILIKAANKGPGGDYVSMTFLSGEIACRNGYPSGIDRPTLTTYAMNGYPIVAADYRSSPGEVFPARNGSIAAKAIVRTCDQVRANGGYLNFSAP